MRKFNKKHVVAGVGAVALAGIFAPILAACTGDIPELNATEIINTLFPNVWVFIAQVIAMCVVFSIILWLVWKPTNRMLDKRRAYIAKEITDAETAKQEALVYLENAKQEYTQAQSEAMLILANAKTESSSYLEATKKEAQEAADKIVATARNNAANEQKAIAARLEAEAREVAYVAAEALMKREISREDNDKLVDEFIKNLESSK